MNNYAVTAACGMPIPLHLSEVALKGDSCALQRSTVLTVAWHYQTRRTLSAGGGFSVATAMYIPLLGTRPPRVVRCALTAF